MRVYNLFVGNGLFWNQNTSAKPLAQVANSSLALVQEVEYTHLGKKIIGAENRLTFTQRISSLNRLSQAVSQILYLWNNAQKVIPQSIYQNLLIYHDETRYNAGNNLIINQSVTIVKTKLGTNTIEFDQIADFNIAKIIPVSQSLEMVSLATAIKPDPNFIGIPITNPPVP